MVRSNVGNSARRVQIPKLWQILSLNQILPSQILTSQISQNPALDTGQERAETCGPI